VKCGPFAMASGLRIGIDFDNTIITYDEVFSAVAKCRGLVDAEFSGRKQALRNKIRLLPAGELLWQSLQGHVYGKGISEARMIAGVDAFLRRCRAEGCAVAIVSHKTEFGQHDPDHVDLRKAALDWMAANGLFGGDLAIPAENVYFEGSREEKLARIEALRLTHFIDDLEEVLTHPAFPPNVKRILFAGEESPAAAPYTSCSAWRDIEAQIFGGAAS
jgi:hypothetical protein